MAKLPRIFQTLFGSSAPGSGVGGIGQFGSLAAGSPTLSTNGGVIQNLDAWAKGWLYAVVGNNGPEMEDMNGFCFLIVQQIAYILQLGVAEWDNQTTYYAGSLVNVGGTLYKSLTDSNTNNATSDMTHWAVLGGNIATKTSTYTANSLDDIILGDATLGGFSINLPAASSVPSKQYIIKQINTNANILTVQALGGDMIDAASAFTLNYDGVTMASVTIISTGTGWIVV